MEPVIDVTPVNALNVGLYEEIVCFWSVYKLDVAIASVFLVSEYELEEAIASVFLVSAYDLAEFKLITSWSIAYCSTVLSAISA